MTEKDKKITMSLDRPPRWIRHSIIFTISDTGLTDISSRETRRRDRMTATAELGTSVAPWELGSTDSIMEHGDITV